MIKRTIIIILPLVLIALCMLGPTFDDWTYFTTPYYEFEPGITDRIIPRNSYWRPFDGLFGLLLTIDHRLFPLLNHIAVFIAHVLSAYMVYILSRRLSLSRESSYIATLFFFISPAMLGTVLGIDSLNQAYSHLWGMISIYAYLQRRHALWMACAIISLFCKENGIAFFFIPIIMSCATGSSLINTPSENKYNDARQSWSALFNNNSIKTPILHAGISVAIIIIYFVLRTALTSDVVYINEEYFDNPILRFVKNGVRFVSLSLIPIDYVSIATASTRNYPLALLTLILSMPFMVMLMVRSRHIMLTPTFVSLISCAFIAALPHIATLFTTMHAYAGLGLLSIAIGMLWQHKDDKTKVKNNTYAKNNTYLIAFILSCLIIDAHHWYCSYESGEQGRRMAQKVLQTIRPESKMCVLYIDTNESKYSSFCVIPYDAFGWGKAVRHYGDGLNPRYIDNYTFQPNDTTLMRHYVDSIRNEGYNHILVVEGSNVELYSVWLNNKKNAR